jgi:hypothetical protein
MSYETNAFFGMLLSRRTEFASLMNEILYNNLPRFYEFAFLLFFVKKICEEIQISQEALFQYILI